MSIRIRAGRQAGAAHGTGERQGRSDHGGGAGVVMPSFWTACAFLRYFRSDRGETLAERGVDDIRLSGKFRTGLRFLALTGFVNLANRFRLPAYPRRLVHPKCT